MTHGVAGLVVALGGSSGLLVVVLLASRLTATARLAHQEKQRRALRRQLLTGLLGEPPDAGAALQDLGSRSGRAWDQVEEAAFALLPKIKGDAHRVLVGLLTDKGAAERATARACSRGMVRRGAVRALGSVGDPGSVRALLDAVVTDDALSRDVVAAIARIGAPAAPALRQFLREVLAPGHQPPEPVHGGPPVRRAAAAAHALGLIGDASDTALLVQALADRTHPRLATAAARALGQLGSPDAVPPLLGALRSEDVSLRLAAAMGLGDISDGTAASELGSSLDDAGHEDARAIAAALLRLGTAGLDALEACPSPYAAEAVALHALRQRSARAPILGA